MARDFDNFPTYDPIVKDKVYLSNIWSDFFETFVETLQSYLSQNGISVPRITTDQRDALSAVENGRIIYNTTINKFQGYENNAWANLI